MIRPAPSELTATLDRLLTLYPRGIDLALDRLHRLLDRLGNPHLALPPVIHVAGTNGKGSTVATLRACLEAAGKRCHVMTSPHLVRFNERIRVAGTLIDDESLLDLLKECESVNAGDPITFFEITTAAGYLAFARNPADVTLLETGMGGRYDATNVIPNPKATIITVISRDHTQWLGETLTAIAGEKAGIMKSGVPCIIAAQRPEAIADGVMDLFDSESVRLGVPLHRCGREWSVEDHGERMIFRDDQGVMLDLPRPNLLGAHQIFNAGNALAALTRLGRDDPAFRLTPDQLARGLTAIDWPARMQDLTASDHPLARLLPEGWELWLDGGHNDSAGDVLADHLRSWAARDKKPVHLVCGMLTTKDARAFLEPLLPFLASLTTIPIPGDPLSTNPDVLLSALPPAAPSGIGTTADDAGQAIGRILSSPDQPPSRILIAGSLHLAGAVLSLAEK